jgi:hypothetical protein
MTTTIPDATEKLLTEEELLADEALKNVPRTKFGRLRRKGFVPFIKLGHKTYLYRKSRVLAALAKLEKRYGS